MEVKTMQSADRISLSGMWHYELDHNDIGMKENWFEKRLKGSGFQLPGTTALNQVGEPLDIEPEMTKEAVRCLRQLYRYVGAAWYQKTGTHPGNMEKQSRYLIFGKDHV